MRSDTSIVFDLDGVLLDSESNLSWLYRALERALHEMNVPITKKNVDLIHSNNVHRLPDLAFSLDIDVKRLWDIRNQCYIEEKITAMKNGTITPFNDVKELYKLQDFYELGILSNSPQIVVEQFLSFFHFDGLFSFGIGRGDSYADIKLMKPHHFMMSKLRKQTKNGKFIYIGDLETDRLFAARNQMDFMFLNRFINHNTHQKVYRSLSEVVLVLISKT